MFRREPNAFGSGLCVDDVDRGFDERWRRNPKPQRTTPGVFEMKTGRVPAHYAGQLVLDAGCGCGRFAHELHLNGVHAIGVDVAPHALEAAVKNGVPRENLYCESLLDLPFIDGAFDAAYSIGVLHHTPDPLAAFLEVARTVRVGGELAVWVYAQPVPDSLLPAHDFLHAITRACPPAALYDACEKYAVALRDMYTRHVVAGTPVGVHRDLATILRVSGSSDDAECISDTFDWHTPQRRFWHTKEEVRGWFEGAGFRVDWTGEFPVSMRGTKVER